MLNGAWLLHNPLHIQLGMGFMHQLMATCVLLIALMLAAGADHLWGEPRNALHPVAWFGRWAQMLARLLSLHPEQDSGHTHWGRRLRGWLAWTLAVVPPTLIAAAIQWGSLYALLIAAQQPQLQAPHLLSILLACAVIMALVLKPCMAWRSLQDHVQAVLQPLDQGDISAARLALARIVSRDVTTLGPEDIRSAALQSGSENLNDSWVAPLFWFTVGGLPAATLYRCSNTLDAMWGYKDHRYNSGWWAARCDDVLSWLPARISSVLIMPRSQWSIPRWRTLYRLAQLTPSPNSGWPMSSLALSLHCQLNKKGVYCLNETASPPTAEHSQLAMQITHRAAQKSLLLALSASLLGLIPAVTYFWHSVLLSS